MSGPDSEAAEAKNTDWDVFKAFPDRKLEVQKRQLLDLGRCTALDFKQTNKKRHF